MKVKKVLISQPQPTTGKSPYFDLAEKYGVEFVFKPFIRVEPLTAKEFRQQHVNILDHTAVVFTSRHAVDHFFQLCAEMRVTIPEDMKYFCITETVSLYINLNDLLAGLKDVPHFEAKESTLIDLLIDASIASSKREAREFINGNAISVNGEIVNDENLVINKDNALDGQVVIIRRGKKKYFVGTFK